MPEQHNIEWKQTWRDEYLKWVCGFANAQGGRIYIGKDDKGNVVGVSDYEKLLTEKHKSRPYNPDIAEAFFRAGLVEAWGRGIAKVQEVCRTQGYPEPEFELLGEDITVTFHASDSAKTAITAFTSEQASDKSVQALGKNVQASDKSVQALDKSVQASKRGRIQQEILSFCEEERSLTEIAAKLGMRHLSYLRKVYISPLLSDKKLEMTHPENPRHMRQQYRTTRRDEQAN